MRPRVRSYGLSSTRTVSPGRMRMKFCRSLPEMWARTSCPFSSRTLNIAFGSGVTTSPSTSIASFFGKRHAPSSTDWLFHCLGDTRKGRRTRRPTDRRVYISHPNGTTALPGGEDVGSGVGDRHRVLEMGGETAVGGAHRPAIAVDLDVVAAEIEHRLDGEAHPGFDAHPGARPAVIGDLRLLVHRGAEAVADARPHDPVSMLARDALDGVADVPKPIPGDCGRDPGLHPAPRAVDELRHFARDPSDGPGAGAVGVPPLHDAPDVDAHDVAVQEAAPRRRDAVDHLVVDAHAD